MKPQNAAAIRSTYLRFIASFSFLLLCVLLCIYSFFRAHTTQMATLGERYTYYNDVYNRQLQLTTKVDSLYYYLNLLNTDQVQNDIFLEKYLTDKKDEIGKMIGTDSLGEFRLYTHLIASLNTVLSNKDSIRKVISQENFIKSELGDCVKNTNLLKKKLENSPVRFSTPATAKQ